MGLGHCPEHSLPDIPDISLWTFLPDIFPPPTFTRYSPTLTFSPGHCVPDFPQHFPIRTVIDPDIRVTSVYNVCKLMISKILI